MTARSTYEGTVNTSNTTLVSTNITNALTCQETINKVGAGPNGGTSLATGVTAGQDATIRAANVTYREALLSAEKARQASVQAARDTLANTGDVGPR
jgi:hypothetical protein